MATKYKLVDGIKSEMTDAEIKAQGFLTAEEINLEKLKALRIIRNQLLAETDWMANSDLTMSNDWKTYRQGLRDITKTYTAMSDKDFKFPTKPS